MRHCQEIVRKIILDPISLLVPFYLVAKYVLYLKIGTHTLDIQSMENDFFPKLLYPLNPAYIDVILVFLILARTKAGYFLALGLSYIQLIHPYSFGTQHYVMSMMMFLWLALKDESSHSIFFGRVTLSFLFMTAAIGKLTPGWISGDHYNEYLKHLDQHPLLIIGGELFNGVAFLLPFYAGIVVPSLMVLGMIYSISFLIFDAVGIILGMYLTFLAIHETETSKIEVSFSEKGWFDKGVKKSLQWLDLPNVCVGTTGAPSPKGRRVETTVSTSIEHAQQKAYGYNAYCQILCRIPVLAFLYPLLSNSYLKKLYRNFLEIES